MISEFSIAKALYDHLKTISGLPTVYAQGAYGDEQEPHIAEILLSGPINSVGLNTGESQTSIYQVDVMTMKNSPKWECLELADIVKAGFPRDEVYTHAGQNVQVVNSSASSIRGDGSFWVCSVSVRYIVFAN